MSYPTEIATVPFRKSTKIVRVHPGTDPISTSANVPVIKKYYNDIFTLVLFHQLM